MPDQQAWEYRLVSMGNPLQPETEQRANAVGRQGWELAAIDAGVWVFKRRLEEEAEAATALQAIIEETVPIAGEPRVGTELAGPTTPPA